MTDQHYRRNFMFTCGAVLVALLIGLGIWHWNQRRIKETFYTRIVMRRDIPEGVGPELTADQWHHRNATYRMRKRGQRLVQMTRVNGSGYPTADQYGHADWRFEYDAANRLVRKIITNPKGNVVRYQVYDGTLTTVVWFRNERGEAISAGEMPIDPEVPLGKSEVTQFEYEYDVNGFAIRQLYQDAKGEPRPDALGVWGVLYQRSLRGLIENECPLDANGRRTALKNGIARVSYFRDQRGNTVRTSYFGRNGEPAMTKGGCSSFRTTYDPFGNWVQMDYYGADGKPVQNKECPARTTAKYDRHGNRIEVAHFRMDGKPVLNEDGIARWTASFDWRGDALEVTSFGVDGNPAGNGSNNLHDGPVKCMFPSGAEYVGGFKNGVYDGWGEYTYANGDKYIGEFRAGKFNGRGSYWVGGIVRADGAWQDDQFLGREIPQQIDRDGVVKSCPPLSFAFMVDSREYPALRAGEAKKKPLWMKFLMPFWQT